MIDARTLFVAYYDEAADELTFQRMYEEGVLFDLGPERTQRSRNSMSFYVCRQRRPLLLHGNVADEAAKLGIEVINVATTKSAVAWMGSPMITGERVLGMISVQHFTDELAYDENDLNLVQAIANQAGIALANARLYQLTDVQLRASVWKN